jgi:eukaryotic-like serine/threonine-protein kinase
MNTRALNFPSDHSLGELFLSVGSAPIDWVKLADAQGIITVPFDAKLRLVVKNKKPIDLAPLSTLEPNALQVIVFLCTNIDEDEFRHVQHLTGLRGIGVSETNVGDTALMYFSKLTGLQWLDIGDTKVTNDGLAFLSPLTALKEVSLLNTEISDDGLFHLMNLHELERLDLMGTRVSDAGIDTLKRLISLRSLRIYDTSISEDGYKSIKAALPECQIKYRHYLYP